MCAAAARLYYCLAEAFLKKERMDRWLLAAGAAGLSLPIASLPIASLPIASLPIASLEAASLETASLPIESLEIASSSSSTIWST